MFTRQHYKAIAEMIANNSVIAAKDESLMTYMNRNDFVDELVDYFAQDNPRFDREKFLKACGLGD